MPGKKIRFDVGETLIRQGDAGDFLYVVLSGKVRIFRKEGIHEIDLGEVDHGGVVGEMSLIDAGPRSAWAVAQSEVEVLRVERTDFDEVYRELPPWLSGMARSLVQRLRNMDNRIDVAIEDFIRSSVSFLLVDLLRCKKSSRLALGDVRRRLADILRSTDEQVDECLKWLESCGVLSLNEGAVEVPDAEALLKLARSLRRKEVHSSLLEKEQG